MRGWLDWLAWEALAFAIGALVGASLEFILWLLATPSAYFTWRAVSASERFRAIATWPIRRWTIGAILNESKNALGAILALSVLAIPSTLLSAFVSDRVYCMTDRFGESPRNRFVRFHSIENDVIAEFGAHCNALDGFQIHVHEREPAGFNGFWFCKPGDPSKDPRDDSAQGFVCGSDREWNCTTVINGRLTPDKSVCIDLGVEASKMDDCIFSKISEDYRHCSTGDLDLIDVPSDITWFKKQ